MAFSGQYLFSASFQKNNCVSVTIGNFTVGEVFLSRGEYEYSPKCFDLHTSQLYDFILLLKKLGTTLSAEASQKVCYLCTVVFFKVCSYICSYHRKIARGRPLPQLALRSAKQ